MQKPSSTEAAPYYHDYINRVPAGSICDILEQQTAELKVLFSRFSDERAATPRIENEWTLKQVLGHLCDSERIFGYRACRISRGDKTPLAGFDQNDFMVGADFNARKIATLLSEFEQLRAANLTMFRNMSDEESQRMGTASENPVSARALAYIIAGHVSRHLEIIRQRYPQ